MTVVSYTLFFKYFLMGGKKCPKCGKKGLFFGIVEKEWLGIRCTFCGYEERIERRGKLPTGLLRLLRSLAHAMTYQPTHNPLKETGDVSGKFWV